MMPTHPTEPVMQDHSPRIAHDTFVVAGRLLDYDEGVVLYHSWRVALLSERIAKAMGLDDPDAIFGAGMLHDIGAIRLTDHIVHQATLDSVTPGAVSHVVEGVRILESVPVTADLAPLVAAHHEQVDGRGYPAGLKGPDIPVEASVIHLADLIDVSLRSMEPKRRVEKIHSLIRSWSQTSVFPAVASAAQDLLTDEPFLLEQVFEPTLLSRAILDPPRRLSGTGQWSPVELTTMLTWLLARLSDSIHDAMEGHSLRVGYYATRIARNLPSLDVSFWEVLWTALIHDLGMASIPRRLIGRAGPLSGPEVSQLREHTIVTKEMVGWIKPLAHLAPAAAAHHEHYDGTGYPEGRAEEEIPLLARILAYADAYDALTSNRPYRLAMSPQRALEEIRRVAGRQLDPNLLKPALQALGEAGPLTSNLPRTIADYMALCETGRFEMGLPARHSTSSARLRPVGQAVVLLPSAPWLVVDLDTSGQAQGLPDEIASVLGFEPDSLQVHEWFDEQAENWLKDSLEQLSQAQTATSYLFTKKNRPVEVTLVKRYGGAEMLLRSAASRMDATRDLTVFYRSFLQSTQPALFLDRGGAIRDTNRSFLNLTGLALKRVVGHGPAEILFGRDDQGVWARIDRAMRNQNVGNWSGDLTIQSDQGPIPVHLTAMAVRDSAGVDVGYLLTLTDRRREVAQELRMRLLNEALLSLGGDYTHNETILVSTLAKALKADQVYYCRRSGAKFELVTSTESPVRDPASSDLSWCNGAIERAESDLIRVSPKMIVSPEPDAGDRFQTRICHVIRMGDRRVGLLCAAFRNRRWLSSLESHFFGTLAGALARQYELSEAHGALRRREEQYRLLSEHASDVIWSVDSEGLIFYANPALEQALGVAPAQVVGRKVQELLTRDMILQAAGQILDERPALSPEPTEDERQAVWARIWKRIAELSQTQPVHVEMELPAQEGDQKFLDITARVVAASPGTFFLHGIARDVTDRKLREQALEHRVSKAEQMSRLKSELIASTSHDLKSPVNAILSYLNLVEDQIEDLDTAGMKRYLGRMRNAADRLLRLISDVMDLEKIEAGVYSWRSEKLDLVPLVESQVALHETTAKSRGVELDLQVNLSSLIVHADEQALDRVLGNLLSNAVKYSTAGGVVTVEISRPSELIARIVVSDQGQGVPSEDLERIFDRFYQSTAPPDPTASGPSSGLGLAIVRKLVELNMGRVWAEHAPGGGARFVVDLPTGQLLAPRKTALFLGRAKQASAIRDMVERQGLILRVVPVQGPWIKVLTDWKPVVLFVDQEAEGLDRNRIDSQVPASCLVVHLGGPNVEALQSGEFVLTDPILEEEMVQIVHRAMLQETKR